MSTPQKAEPMHLGNKLYQVRARKALPLLVRQAKACKAVFYSDIAQELSMANPRNLNFVLGSIGTAIQWLAQEWGAPIPPIQYIVVNKGTGVPGVGISDFFDDGVNFATLDLRQKQHIIELALLKITTYPHWDHVLSAFGLEASIPPSLPTPQQHVYGPEESEAHKRLKEFVTRHPTILGLPEKTPVGITEVHLPSGDRLDVSFENAQNWFAAEVKSHLSSEADILRGMFQCIKYEAIMEATRRMSGQPLNIRAMLILEGPLPKSLIPARNVLGVTILDNIHPN